MEADHCPAQAAELAEAYVMGDLPDAEAAIFSEHLLTCAKCRAAVEQADVYVRAMRDAASELSRSK